MNIHKILFCRVFSAVFLASICKSTFLGKNHGEKHRIVISHFNEPLRNLTWLHNYSYTIYSRSDCGEAYGLHLTPLIENVGREGFIYLQHIIRNYHNLDEMTVFLQGDDAIDNARVLQDAINELISGHEAFQTYGFLYMLPICLQSNIHYSNFMPKLMEEFNLDKVRGNITLTLMNDYDQEFSHLISLLYDVKVDKPTFTPHAAFAVSRAVIHRHPICYYVKLARRLGTENKPPVGFFYERTWSYLFGSECIHVKGCNYFFLCR